jgi:hypothetical protein
MLYKNRKILRECGEETSWLDPAPGPGPDSYTIQLEGGAWRSHAWNAKDGIVETHLILPTNHPTSEFGPNQVSVYAPYPAAIHVGLRAPDCCHDHTGPLEGALMQSLAETILDAPDMRLFNRFNRGAGYPVNPGLDGSSGSNPTLSTKRFAEQVIHLGKLATQDVVLPQQFFTPVFCNQQATAGDR